MESKKVSFNSIDEYIATFPEAVQKLLQKVRATIKATAPKSATEKISYQMPCFELNGSNLIHFAAFKNHIGIYGAGGAIEVHKELAAYAGPKGTLKFPYAEPLPVDLIRKIVKFRVADNREKTKLKAGKRK
jgi:uncharacterized protein YdhG (YjbR/CyaY superfamily)